MNVIDSMALCIRCQEALTLESRLLVGEVVHCLWCNAQHEVYGLDPLEIGPRSRVEEDESDFEGWPKAS